MVTILLVTSGDNLLDKGKGARKKRGKRMRRRDAEEK
jgi:hypothetical protein